MSEGQGASVNVDFAVVSRDRALEDFARKLDDILSKLKTTGREGGNAGKQISQGLDDAGKKAEDAGKKIAGIAAKLSSLATAAASVINTLAQHSAANASAGSVAAVTVAGAANAAGISDPAGAARMMRQAAANNPQLGPSGVAAAFQTLASGPRFRAMLNSDPQQAATLFNQLMQRSAYMAPDQRQASFESFNVLAEAVGAERAGGYLDAAQSRVPSDVLARGLSTMRPAILASRDPERAVRAALGLIGNVAGATQDAELQGAVFGLVNDAEYRKYLALRRGGRDAADVMERMQDPANLRIRTAMGGLEGVGLTLDQQRAMQTAMRGVRGAAEMTAALADMQGSGKSLADRRAAAAGASQRAIDEAQARLNRATMYRERADMAGEAAALERRAYLEANSPQFAASPLGALAINSARVSAAGAARTDQGRRTAETAGGLAGAGTMAAAGAAGGTAIGGPIGALVGGSAGAVAGYFMGAGAGAAVHNAGAGPTVVNNYNTNIYNPADGGGATEQN